MVTIIKGDIILINYPLFQALLSISSIPYSAYWLPQPTFCQQQPCSSLVWQQSALPVIKKDPLLLNGPPYPLSDI